MPGLQTTSMSARSVRPMYLVLSKKPRKTDRSRSKRYRAKLKAKDRGRRGRVYQVGRR